jgi:Concanavalin A-like lectin/glucanases superfamily
LPYQLLEQRARLVNDVVEHAYLQVVSAEVRPGALIQWHPFIAGDMTGQEPHRQVLRQRGVDRTGKVTNRAIASSSTPLDLGRNRGGFEHFPGLIDEVAIYNVALSDDQVQRHFNASGH